MLFVVCPFFFGNWESGIGNWELGIGNRKSVSVNISLVSLVFLVFLVSSIPPSPHLP
ncbi:MAG: hypothetical protein F6K47_39870 [Symploca sp. SIO2E6]|nr:hypothetical protein [Symploca sp. SIO2E6]